MAIEDGRPLARAMAGPANGHTGSFTLFDCLPRPDAVAGLIAAVADFQRQRGCRELVGPTAFGPADVLAGALVSGFGGVPAALCAYNAPWYGECLEAAGLRKRRDRLAYRLPAEALPRAVALGERAAARHRIAVGRADRRRPRALADALAAAWGVRPDRAAAALAPLLPSLDGRFALIARAGGAPIGALVGLPDRFGGLRLATMAVAPAWRGRGAAAALAGAMARAIGESGIRRVEASLIDETNEASRLCAERMGGTPCRVYREYQMPL
ncbi:MAG: GNAT family N-acetyltransferase [Clostridiales bacterium]|nr:GNAT family N-acetyltransferase [Clostridiales bacterium]